MEEKKSRSFISILQSLCVLYITIWTIAPPLQIDNIYRIAALGAVGLWFLLNIPQKVTLERIHILAIIFAMLVMIVALMDSGGRFRKILDPINYYMLVITFIMGYCYKDRWHELSWMIPIILLLLVYFNFQTYKTVLDDPSAARTLVRNDASAYHYMRRGVGGYGLLYPQVCILPIIVSWTISAFRKHWVRFAIGVLWIISFFLYLFNAGYSIAVAASIVAVVAIGLNLGKQDSAPSPDEWVRYAYGEESSDREMIMATVDASLADFFGGETPAEANLIEMFKR